MIGIIPGYKTPWEILSEKHKGLEDELDEILRKYSGAPGSEFKWAYATIGVFGAGKTQFLYHIFEKSLENGFLPLYFIAEDLFGDIFKLSDMDRSPGALSELVLTKIKKAREAIANNDKKAVEEILNPTNKDEPKEMIKDLLDHFAAVDIDGAKTVVLVDELEQQYKPLQDSVRTGDRSPLRDWLERKDSLKFLALAPTGIYEMGGADQTRCGRLVIPPVDVTYIRQNYFPEDQGKANACWWLSRGKPRHVFKAFEKLKDIDANSMDADEIYFFIRDELDYIGQRPSGVPSANLEELEADKYRYVIDLNYVDGEKRKRYCINVNELSTASLTEALLETFKLKREDAVIISYYFKTVVKALSDEDDFVYIDPNDFPELLALTLNLLLEYEHGSPGIKERLGDLMGLYEGFKEPILHVYLPRIWETRDTLKKLPLSIGEMRRTFPFPIMNPMVKTYVPENMKKKWEGNGLPIWRWKIGNITVLFFASQRDFDRYSQTDEFLDLTIPQERGAIYILPAGEREGEDSSLLQWLERNGKLKKVTASPLITGFLLSLAGEIKEQIPEGLMETLSTLEKEKEEPILSRKVKIYSESINELIQASLPKPVSFCVGAPMDADTIWGQKQMGERDVAVPSVALAFVDLDLKERILVAQLHELFKGGSSGGGVGDLHFSLGRRGHISIATQILPRYVRGELKDTGPISRLRGYFKGERELAELARLVTLPVFLKLEDNADINRLLEAFWRAIRGEFDYEGLDELILWLEREVVPTIEEAIDLERKSIELFGLEGIDFEDAEDIVRAKDAFKKDLQGAKNAIENKGGGATLVKALYKLFSIELKNEERCLKFLQARLREARDIPDKLNKAGEDLKKNFWECRDAVQFTGLGEEDIEKTISSETTFKGEFNLQEMSEKAEKSKNRLENISNDLNKLESRIGELNKIFSGFKEG